MNPSGEWFCPLCGTLAEPLFSWDTASKSTVYVECPAHGELRVSVRTAAGD